MKYHHIVSGYKLACSERGITLIETLAAVAIFGLVSVIFLGSLTVSLKSNIAVRDQTMAESLIRSEMEYVKACQYWLAPWDYELPPGPLGSPPWDPTHNSLPSGYEGYSIQVVAACLTGHDPDDGIQKVTATVTRDGAGILTIETYKGDR